MVIAVAGYFGITMLRGGGATNDKSIAVLPFENTGGDTANAYFADGMADELISALGKVRTLRVAARSSSFSLRGKNMSAAQIGKVLNVRSVLEGQVRRSGSTLILSAQLSNTRDGLVVWSERYTKDAKDVFAVQDAVAKAIVNALQVNTGSPCQYARQVGYKISAERLSANDFSNVIYYPALVAGGTTLPETIADFHTDVSRVSGALVYYLGAASTVQFNGGSSIRNGLGDLNSGQDQIKDWTCSDYQLLFSSRRWFAQAYMTHGNSGNTNQRYASVPLAARNPTLSADSVWELTRYHVDGRIIAAELQNNFLVRSLAKTGVSALDNSLVTWGGQVRGTRNSSYRTVLLDYVTKKPIETSQGGFYGQVESPLSSKVRTVISRRYDAVSRFPGQFSPRASVLYSPKPDQTFRVTYGEAYRTPPILTADSYGVPNATTRNIGNQQGFTIKDVTGKVVSNITGLDTVKTKPTDPADAGLFNTSSSRLNLSFETTDLPKNFDATATMRYVNGYQFRSATIWGQVPMYGTLDLSASWRVPGSATKLTIQGQNLAACIGGTSVPPVTGISSSARATFVAGQKCGFGQRHQELLDMPLLGPTVIVGVRKEWR